MSEGARVESIDALREFRIALVKFAEASKAALGDVESDLRDTQNWLETEQATYWNGQIRKRHDLVERAKEAVRMKKMFKDSTGRTPHAIEEEKALRLAQVRSEEAEEKLQNVKKYTRILQKEIEAYKGSVQRFATTLQLDIPMAIALLEQHATTLDNYVNVAPVDMQPTAPPSVDVTSEAKRSTGSTESH